MERPKEIAALAVAPWPDVKLHIDGIADELDAVLATIQATRERDNQSLALFNLGRRALYEVRRVATHLEDDITELAWSVRNLHEIDLILQRIADDPDAMLEWTAQMVTDEEEIAKGFLALGEILPEEQKALLRQRVQAVTQAAANLKLEHKRPWSMARLAMATGRADEYAVFYRLFSKFVHPSSWLVNANRDRIESYGYRNLLVGLTQVLGRRVRQVLVDTMGLAAHEIAATSTSAPW